MSIHLKFYFIGSGQCHLIVLGRLEEYAIEAIYLRVTMISMTQQYQEPEETSLQSNWLTIERTGPFCQ